MRRITFYLDFVSPYAYLAFKALPEALKGLSYAVDYRPVLFAGLLKHHGQLGPAEVPAKGAWMIRNVLRKAARLGVPLRPPAVHPFNPLLALRLSSLPMEDAVRLRVVDGLFRAVFEPAAASTSTFCIFRRLASRTSRFAPD